MAKKQLSRDEEFQIMKMVMDKFLWMGVLIMAFGFYKLVTSTNFWSGFYILVAGVIMLLIFMMILLKEFHIKK